MAEFEPDRSSPDLRATGDRIETLLDASAAGGMVARERAEELIRLVTDLYGAGLERILEILHECGRLDEEVLALLAHDELVSGLLLIHGLHPYDLQTRIEQALESVRPYLGSHGGDVELLSMTQEGTVRLRLLGSCDGCPSSSVTLELAVESAIEAAAPEVTGIEVETASAPHAHAGPVISVESLRSRLQAPTTPGGGGATWYPVPALAQLSAGGLSTVEVGSSTLLACRIGTDVFAFLDRCARCGSSLAGATLARRLGGAAADAVLTCSTCQVHYDVRHAGACLDVPELHLEPLPLLADGPGFSVALPRSVLA